MIYRYLDGLVTMLLLLGSSNSLVGPNHRERIGLLMDKIECWISVLNTNTITNNYVSFNVDYK